MSDHTQASSSNGLTGPVLVTGGTGFIGRALIKQILTNYPKLEIRSLALPGETVPDTWRGRVETLQGDITSSVDVERAAAGAETIFHLAALLGGGSYERHRQITVGGTEQLLKAAVDNHARIIVVSSIAVYGYHVRDRVCDESIAHGQQYGPYCLAKQEQETITLRYINEYALDACIARPANVYGAGSLPWVDVVAAAMQAGAPVIVNNGIGNAGLVHPHDVATALTAIAKSGRSGEAYNICAEMDVSWHRYFGDLSNILDLDLPDSVTYAALEAQARMKERPEERVVPQTYTTLPLATLALIGSDNRFPTHKLRSELGWSPEVDYATALMEIRHYLERK